jgi:hypothetical protein
MQRIWQKKGLKDDDFACHAVMHEMSLALADGIQDFRRCSKSAHAPKNRSMFPMRAKKVVLREKDIFRRRNLKQELNTSETSCYKAES